MLVIGRTCMLVNVIWDVSFTWSGQAEDTSQSTSSGMFCSLVEVVMNLSMTVYWLESSWCAELRDTEERRAKQNTHEQYSG